jgi:chitin synthase
MPLYPDIDDFRAQ